MNPDLMSLIELFINRFAGAKGEVKGGAKAEPAAQPFLPKTTALFPITSKLEDQNPTEGDRHE